MKQVLRLTFSFRRHVLVGFITFAFVALVMVIVGSSKILAPLNGATLANVMYFGLLGIWTVISAGVGFCNKVIEE